MKPAKMFAIDRMLRSEREPRSEYGGNNNRRMIGFDRNGDAPRNAMPGHIREYPPMSGGYDYEGGNGSGMNANWPQRHMGEYPPTSRYPEPEARRRRDSRGRYAMGDMEYDGEEIEDYSPRSMMRGYPRGETEYRPRMHYGGDYGDVYARCMIYAPGAMNRPMGGMMGDMSEPVDEHTARMWVGKMEGGEHFKPEQAEQFRNAICPDCEKWEYYVAINAAYSDHCKTAKEMGVDKPEYYAHVARDFLKDKDAGPHKLRKYMTTIPK